MNNISKSELFEQIRQHEEWITSRGERGHQLSLVGYDLTGLDLSSAILPAVNFDKAILRQTDLYRANLASSSFRNADMTGVILTKANLDYAILRNAVLKDSKLFKATFYESDLTNADLTNADLRVASFTDAHLEFTILCNADFSGADFERVFVHGADLQGVKGLNKIKTYEWIDIGTEENPIRLEGDILKNWLKDVEKS